MPNMVLTAETAALFLTAYLLGCVLAYSVRRVLYAARGTRTLSTQPANAPIKAEKSLRPAARLAASVDASPLPTASKSSKPRARPSANPKPATLSEPRQGVRDDLQQIKGIGPKIEASLHSMGIFHIDQIARWTRANVEWVDGQLTFKGRIRRERWVEQARQLNRTKADA